MCMGQKLMKNVYYIFIQSKTPFLTTMLRFINKPNPTAAATTSPAAPSTPTAAPTPLDPTTVKSVQMNEMTREMNNSEKLYYNSLNDVERMAMVIAKDHLSTSFCLSKTIGYKTFISTLPSGS